MQRLEVSSAVRPIYGSLGVKMLRKTKFVTAFTKSPQRIQYQCCAIRHEAYLAILLQILPPYLLGLL